MKPLRRFLAIVVALVLVAGVAGLVALDRYQPARAIAAPKPSGLAVAPGAATVVCPAQLALPGDEEGRINYDPRFDPAPTDVTSVVRALARGTGGGDVSVVGGSGQVALPTPLGSDSEAAGTSPWAIQARSNGQEAAWATGGAIIRVGDGDLRGLAASACITPGTEAWLIGGETRVQDSARLLLTNPGLTDVTASFELWDGAGKVDAVGTTGLVVPAQSQRAVLLEGIQADAARLAVHVTASGGDLAASLQDSRLNGLVPGGVDFAIPGAGPATSQIVPGLNLLASTFDAANGSVLRLLNPSTKPATVNVTLWGPDGPVSLPGLDQATVAAGTVTDLSLAGLAKDGIYAAQINSDQPVVAAGLSWRAAGAEDPVEFAWSPSVTAPAHGYVPLPQAGVDGVLAVASPVDAKLKVTPVNQGERQQASLGTAKSFDLKAGTTKLIKPGDAGAGASASFLEYELAGGGELALAMVLTSSDAKGPMLAVATPSGAAQTGSVVSVVGLP
jgi:hypothetical protein